MMKCFYLRSMPYLVQSAYPWMNPFDLGPFCVVFVSVWIRGETGHRYVDALCLQTFYRVLQILLHNHQHKCKEKEYKGHLRG